jgi:hypothetical protein
MKQLLSIRFLYCIALLSLFSCKSNQTEPAPKPAMQLAAARVGNITLDPAIITSNTPIDQPVVVDFSVSLDTASVSKGVTLLRDGVIVPGKLSWLNDEKTFSLLPRQQLQSQQKYKLSIESTITGKKGETFKGTDIEFITQVVPLTIASMKIGTGVVGSLPVVNVPLTNLVIEVNFSLAVDPSTVNGVNIQVLGLPVYTSTLSLQDNNKKLIVTVTQALPGFTRCRLFMSDQLKGIAGEPFAQKVQEFFTAIDPTPKFPVITDDALLTLVEQQTFKYFWDFGHPVSGLSRERNASLNTVTIGGSGFGIMTIPVAVQRNFITRSEGIARLSQIISFLESADRFHGVWPHWMDGNTGKVIPFGTDDDGGDLVETSFMLQGLLTVRQFLNAGDATENTLIQKINTLYQSVEFDWYTQGGQNVLYWHWSPRVGWKMNMPIRGYDEALIVYVLAASSPTHIISASVYHQGWASNGGIKNGRTYYGTVLPLGFDYGGPLFFTHYSFLGLNPTNLSDTYANYWSQNVSHTMINQAYCVANPLNKVGYSDACWGLTASDNESGYSAHSPTNDLGVITPTAALSSFPYTPVESMKALKFFYYTVGDKLWGPYGFYDAFNPGKGWYATSYLAIDQGPIVVMIENYRTQLLWNLFMSSPEIQTGLTKLNFTH